MYALLSDITSVMPVFDADTFLSEVLKSNNKTVADAFWKYAVKNKKRVRIFPEICLMGKRTNEPYKKLLTFSFFEITEK